VEDDRFSGKERRNTVRGRRELPFCWSLGKGTSRAPRSSGGLDVNGSQAARLAKSSQGRRGEKRCAEKIEKRGQEKATKRSAGEGKGEPIA